MTALLSHTFMDRHDRLEYIHCTESYFRMLEMSVYESETVARLAMYAANLHGCVQILSGGTQWHYLHRSPKYDTLQLTTWDEYGPVSDIMVREPSDFSYLMDGTVKILSGPAR